MRDSKRKILKDVKGEKRYGTMGEETRFIWEKHGTYYPIHVGDLVSFKVDTGDIRKGLIVNIEGNVGVMGSVGRGVAGLDDLQVVIPYKYVTDEIAKHLHHLMIVEPKPLTLREVERELGYMIEIVED